MPISVLSTASVGVLDVLRSRFKERCLASENRFQNWQIRVHRSLSWLDRAFELDPEQQPDGRLLFDWVAFNALYGRWDEREGFPAPDTLAWKDFLRRAFKVDQGGLLAARLTERREDILKLAENKYLDPRFWQNPSEPGNLRRRYFEATALFFEKRWLDLAILTIERIYVLRGQLVHGAATRGSRLNRETLEQSLVLLEQLLLPMLEVVIEKLADDDWPTLCYPPLGDTVPAGSILPARPR